MLDTETKRRIDSCRDILVGKVPDPKSQVEQITIALIYKFMDDMDAEAEELGGKRKFFAGEYAKYGWAKLMAHGMGGHEVLGLYAEAIAKMNENPGVPTLFRDIFKNAYLPYRDPETLKSFLKEINVFSYDHSEKLGDAFEYLLSVLGSQGDAGQFRTPRHIIDFMVDLMDPKKDEAVLDPACGTAGFLISAYKHILANNTQPGGRPGDQLKPNERKRLAENIQGYDISPDMVRLSLANLYLHGFANPRVEEYDTLTSDTKWNECADVILANPPFMSPKGGIKPHNKFSVQATRSEVLFVDYIAEHLTPGGRAAIVVPEGIIFQSQTAYKKLRQMLVKDSLMAVISLPAGVFQPYSGVKTSILILDKRAAKSSPGVLFAKVENDGFGLGAQRREMKGSDLPGVTEMVREFLGGKGVDGLVVERVRILGSGDVGLSGERYREGKVAGPQAWPHVALGDETIFKVESGGTPKSTEETYWNGGIQWATLADMPQDDFVTEIHQTKRTISAEGLAESSAKVLPAGTVIVSSRATIGRVGIARVPMATNQGSKNIVIQDASRATPEFVAYMMKQLAPRMEAMATGGTFKEISKSAISTLQIPLPPLEIQREIVAEIEGYQKIIDGARMVVENWKPRIEVGTDCPMVELGSVCEEIRTGPFGTALHQSDYVANGVPLVNPQDIVDGLILTRKIKTVSTETRDRLSEFTLRTGDIVIGRRGEMGRCAIVSDEMSGWLCGTGSCIIRLSKACDAHFVCHQLQSSRVIAYLEQKSVGVTMMNLNHGILKAIQIPLPPLPLQQSIVAEIQAEQSLVNSIRELITRFEQKIQSAIARVWGA